MTGRVYLDHAATTPVVAAAQEEMARGLAEWANPSSPHADGRRVRARLEDARRRIAAALGWDGAVLFTSGATEALAIALNRAKLSTRFASAVEHDAVFRSSAGLNIFPVDATGIVKLDGVHEAGLVAVQLVNNETGVIQPLEQVAAAVRGQGGLLLADCAQSAGKIALPDADFIALSAHKLGGPPGIGALLVRDLATLEASGGQEQGYRPGTENVPAVLAFAAALEQDRGWVERMGPLRARVEQAILSAGGEVIGRDSLRIPTIGSYRMPGVAATAQLIQFDLAGISVSAGSACSSGSLKPSHVLRAMGLADEAAREVIRVSFGRQTTNADVDRFIAEWTRIAARAQAARP